ncbi:sensor histidine kinase [Halosimplex amylolyticum]|uniref:sensor histidine kinase n=1 Tax=Halosimplex amylolyticum TaxID=3396616 RepID=UPI003F55EF1A
MVGWLGIYQVGLVVSSVVSGLSAAIAWRNRGARGGVALAITLGAHATWAVSTLVGTLAPGTEIAVVTSKIVITAVVVLTAAFFVFALQYTGHESYVRRETLALLAIEPVATTALIWTNEAHGLMYVALEPGSTGASGLTKNYGPAFIAHTVYSYSLLVIAIFLVVIFVFRSRYMYKRQVAAVSFATFVPLTANAVSLALHLQLDLTPIVFTVTGVAFTWAVAREGLLNVTPIATEIILDDIDTGVIVVDTGDRVVDINDSASELFDVSKEGVIGASIPELVSERPTLKTAYEAVTAGRTSESWESQVDDRYFRAQSSPLIDRRDEVVGYALLVVDLTEQRERELELERRNEQLDRFAGVVSHDLRNPLQVASGRLELARRDGKAEHFEAIERSHERMERLIEDLLSLARLDEGLDVERVDNGEVAESAWTHVDTADSTLVVSVDELFLDADRDRLSQLFENLFRNSVEHGGDGVTVSVESLPDGRGFAVSDDGPGFVDADVDAVFDDGYTTSRDGTGFGLSIVAEIADQHGWSVEAIDADAGARIEVTTGEKMAMVN